MRPFPLGHRTAILVALGTVVACSGDSTSSGPTSPGSGSLSLTNSTVTVDSASLTADGAGTATITVRLKNQADSNIDTSDGSVSISATAGTLGSVTDHHDGTYTAVITAPLHTAVATITAERNGLLFAHSATISFVPGPPVSANSYLSIDDTVMYADGVSTTTVTLRLADVYGNKIAVVPSPVALATTNGTLSTPTIVGGAYLSTLTSPHSIGTASVSASLGGVPFLTPFSVRFALHQIWVRKSAIICCRFYMGGVVDNGTMYVTGGYENDPWDEGTSTLDEVDAYDSTANAWTIGLAPMLTARSNHGVGVVNGVVYVVGGLDANGAVLNSVEAYDPATKIWTAKAPMPTARWGLGVSAVGGILYAVGGSNAGALDNVEAYDPATDSWSVKAPLPSARWELGLSAVGGILYAVGGYDAARSATTALYAYDPVANSWTAKASMVTPRGGLAAGAFGTKLFALGGSNQTFDSNQTFELYDPANNSWSSQPSMPQGGDGLVASAVNGGILAVGIGDGSGVFSYVP